MAGRPGPPAMRRFPWVSVALLVVLGLLAALTYPARGDGAASAAEDFEAVYLVVGWISVGLALVIGALGVWARAPATLPTALGIIGAGAFAGAWLTQSMAQDDPSGLHLGMVVAFSAVLVAFAASARRAGVAES